MASVDSLGLGEFIVATIRREVAEAGTNTHYREPLVGFAAADDPRFPDLCRLADPTHLMPHDLLAGARSAVSFFLPFNHQVVKANARHREQVAHEWAEAYLETNALIGRIAAHLVELLVERNVRAAAEPPSSISPSETRMTPAMLSWPKSASMEYLSSGFTASA